MSVGHIHFAGAVMAFGVGSVYLWIQVWHLFCLQVFFKRIFRALLSLFNKVVASFQLCYITHKPWIRCVRIVLAVISTVGFVLTIVMGEIAHSKFHGKWQGIDVFLFPNNFISLQCRKRSAQVVSEGRRLGLPCDQLHFRMDHGGGIQCISPLFCHWVQTHHTRRSKGNLQVIE